MTADAARTIAGEPPAPGIGSDSLTARLVPLLMRPVSAADRRKAALHVLDFVGCAAIGATTAAGRALRAHAVGAGEGPSRVILGPAVPAAAAAFANGGFGNVLEMDDIHRTSILHPGPVVVPAALAVAEARGADGAGFLDAVVAGYEAMARVGRSVGPGHYRLWHNTGTCGPFGAAAAVGRLLGLSADAMVWALGNAGTQASGPWQTRREPQMAKQLHTARAAHAGLVAAELAACGFTGPAFILEGPEAFYAATCPDPDPAAVLVGPEDPWLVHETSFKPWPACRHAHPAIDAALALREAGVHAEDVAAIRVETYADAIRFCDRPEPATTVDAKFSLQHAVAAVLAHGPPPLEAFEAAGRADPAIVALRRRASAVESARFTDAYPARYGAAVVVETRDGAERRAEAPDALGDPDNPLPPEGVEAKARTLMGAAGAPEEAADAVIAACRDLAAAPDLARLSAALAALGR